MAIHFMSVLGTSLYEPIIYRDDRREYQSVEKMEFVQMAFIEEYIEEIKKDGKITIFLTDKSRTDNWENRKYKDYEIERRITQGIISSVEEAGEKIGLKEQLEEAFPEFIPNINIVDIPDGKSEEEIWTIFEKIFDTISEEEDLMMDITHSFRSIPLLAVTVLNYAKVLKNCTLRGIYYGAYEAKEKEESSGEVIAPILDLTLYNNILDWTAASESFMYSGNMKQINDLLKDVMRNATPIARKKLGGISGIVSAMNLVSESVDVSRGSDMETLKNKLDPERSIKNAYTNLKKKINSTNTDNAKEVKPLYPLLNKASERYDQYFNADNNYEVGLGVVRWSIDHDMTQQGYTALEESIKTYLCYYYGVNDSVESTRDGIMGYLINSISSYMEAKHMNAEKIDSERDAILQSIMECDSRFAKSEEWHKENHELVKYFMETIDMRLVDLARKVKNFRNDINHFGFRAEPTPASRLKARLQECYEDMMIIVNDMNRRKKEGDNA